jgi:NAD(P)-dependent dehydrogenase (short-subunit alcohol dehydrogenase family)
MKMLLGLRWFNFYDRKFQAKVDCLLILGFNSIVLSGDSRFTNVCVLQSAQYGMSVYSATKYGVKGLAEALRLELMRYNIGVTVVFPGYVETPMLDECKPSIPYRLT